MLKQPYQKPSAYAYADVVSEGILCQSVWTDGSIGDTQTDWNKWGEI